MPSFFMRDRRVLDFRPSRSAAFPGPLILQRQSWRTCRMWARSTDSRSFRETGGFCGFTEEVRHASSCKTGVGDRIMARSITFSSSRTLPGQSYSTRASIIASEICSNFLPSSACFFAMKCVASKGMSLRQAQRRDVDRKHGQTIVQVGSKGSGGDSLSKIAIRGGNHTHIDGLHAWSRVPRTGHSQSREIASPAVRAAVRRFRREKSSLDGPVQNVPVCPPRHR